MTMITQDAGQPPVTKDDIEKLLASGSPDAYVAAALWLANMGDTLSAIDTLAVGIETHPDNADLLAARATLMANTGAMKAAAEDIAAAKRKSPALKAAAREFTRRVSPPGRMFRPSDRYRSSGLWVPEWWAKVADEIIAGLYNRRRVHGNLVTRAIDVVAVGGLDLKPAIGQIMSSPDSPRVHWMLSMAPATQEVLERLARQYDVTVRVAIMACILAYASARRENLDGKEVKQ